MGSAVMLGQDPSQLAGPVGDGAVADLAAGDRQLRNGHREAEARAPNPCRARHLCSGLFLEFELVSQRDPVVAHERDLGLQAGPAVINGTAMHAHQAETATLVKAQRINIVIGGNDPQAPAPVLHRQLLNRLDQRGPCPVPLPGSVKGQDLALLPVHFSHTWLDRGGAERDLMELNGWTSPQMLTRYGASARGARARRSYNRVMNDST
jgi:hypothetical protein